MIRSATALRLAAPAGTRPAAPSPSPATFNRLLLLSVRLLTTTTPTTPPAEPTSSQQLPPSQAPTPAAGPYRVCRSMAQNLPVYHRFKSGRTNKTTEVKKIEGDARALSRQLGEELGLEAKVNPRTNHVVIKGLHKDKIIPWLEQRGF